MSTNCTCHFISLCFFLDTIDGSEIPNNHLGWCKNLIKNGEETTNLDWLAGFLPSTVVVDHQPGLVDHQPGLVDQQPGPIWPMLQVDCFCPVEVIINSVRMTDIIPYGRDHWNKWYIELSNYIELPISNVIWKLIANVVVNIWRIFPPKTKSSALFGLVM